MVNRAKVDVIATDPVILTNVISILQTIFVSPITQCVRFAWSYATSLDVTPENWAIDSVTG